MRSGTGKGEQIDAPVRIKAFVFVTQQHLKIARVDLVGLDVGSIPHGASLARHWRDGATPTGAPVFAERRPWSDAEIERVLAFTAGDGADVLRERPTTALGEKVSVVSGSWKYIWSDGEPDELYDLRADPLELDNVADREAQTRARMERQLLSAVSFWSLPPKVTRSEEAQRFLRALGYAGGAEEEDVDEEEYDDEPDRR